MSNQDTHIREMYFLGIGGIGMSALARYYHTRGIKVSGYDKTPSPITDQLIEEGIEVHFEDQPELIPQTVDVFVYTPAIPDTLQEFVEVMNSGKPVLKRSEALGMLSKNLYTVAVAGTHGKTTITSIVAHIFKTAEESILAFIGGLTKNYDSNVLMSEKPEVLIVEADEFDRSFLTLYPDIALISAIDADHLDIYGSRDEVVQGFVSFANQVKPNGTLVLNDQINAEFTQLEKLKYGFEEKADYSIRNFRIVEGHYIFDLAGDVEMKDVHFYVPGRHNLLNAVGATVLALKYGISKDVVRKALETYKGVKRRFDVMYQGENAVYIDDYAHHPEELKYCISSVRELYPEKKITGIFQPHLFTRTQDFADEFAQSLELLDEVILLDIYPAREEPIEGVNSQWLLDKVNKENKYLIAKEKLVDFLRNRKDEVLITMGAGDIDRLVEPVQKMLVEKNNG